MKTKMKHGELVEKVALLRDGQCVEIAGDWFRAVRIAEGWEVRACEACDLDSICQGDVAIVCSELDKPLYTKYYLKLAHP